MFYFCNVDVIWKVTGVKCAPVAIAELHSPYAGVSLDPSVMSSMGA